VVDYGKRGPRAAADTEGKRWIKEGPEGSGGLQKGSGGLKRGPREGVDYRREAADYGRQGQAQPLH
jgi:hypothetical protein